MSAAQKIPLAQSLNEWGARKVADQIQLLGKALPCSIVSMTGAIATINFDVAALPFTLPNIQVPIAFCKYQQPPLQPGDTGVCMPADAMLGGISGLGSGTADLRQPGNLTALVFMPVSNAAFVGGGMIHLLQGPGGVTLQDDAGACKWEVTPTGVQLIIGGVVVIEATATSVQFYPASSPIPFVITPSAVTIMGRDFLAHEHSGVQPGSGNSGGVV